MNAKWSFSVNSLKTGFIEKESPLEWVLNALLFNEQETTVGYQLNRPNSDIVLVLAPKGRVKNEYYHDFKASHGFEIPYANAYVYVQINTRLLLPTLSLLWTSSDFTTFHIYISLSRLLIGSLKAGVALSCLTEVSSVTGRQQGSQWVFNKYC